MTYDRSLEPNEQFKAQINRDFEAYNVPGMHGYTVTTAKFLANSTLTAKAYFVDEDGGEWIQWVDEERKISGWAPKNLTAPKADGSYETFKYLEETTYEYANFLTRINRNEGLIYKYDEDAGQIVQSVDMYDGVDDFILMGATTATTVNDAADETLNSFLVRSMRAWGSPPQWTKYVDPRIYNVQVERMTFHVGRRYAETIMGAPTILSLSPGQIEYNSKIGASGWKDTLVGFLDGDSMSKETAAVEALSNASGSMVRFTPTWNKISELYLTNSRTAGYMAYVNALSQLFAIYLGRNAKGAGDRGKPPLANRKLPESVLLKDYNDFQSVFGTKGTYGSIDWENIDGKDDVFDFTNLAGAETHMFAHFYVMGQISASEEFDTEVRASTIESTVNGKVSDVIKDVAFLTGGLGGENENAFTEDLNRLMSETSEGLGGIIGSIVSSGASMLRGGKIVFPQVIDDCSYSKGCQFTCKFTSMSGDVEDLFWSTLAPLAHILPFVLPKQVGDSVDMYSYPFVCKAFATGIYNCPMGVLKGFSMTRGGSDNELWTGDGLPTEIEVKFEIAPLYSKLMMSSSKDKEDIANLLKNTGLQEFVGTLTGVDLRLGDTDLKWASANAMMRGWMVDIPQNFMTSLVNRLGVREPVRSVRQFAASIERFKSAVM